MFGTQGAAELGKSIAKVVFLGAVSWWSVSGDIDKLNGLAANDAHAAAGTLGSMLVNLLCLMNFSILAYELDMLEMIEQLKLLLMY